MMATIPPLTQTCAILLRKIGRTRNACAVGLIMIFADALDDAEHPYANRVRKFLATYAQKEQYAATADFSKRRDWGRGIWIGSWRKVLRRNVGRLFKRNWKTGSNQDFI